MAAAKDAVYFPSLHGLRAVAAFAVLFTHVERYKQAMGRPSCWGMPFNSLVGSLAVTFFFVLSGFLITSLLLRERAGTGYIDIKKFLAKRMLRIWPLYYTVLIGGYLVSIFLLKDTPSDSLRNGFFLNLFLLSNVAFALNKIPEVLIQIWSIGTEEQFYFLWPFLLKRLRIKALARCFILLIIGWFVVRLLVARLAGADSFLNILLYRTRIDCMAIGGLAALPVLHKRGLRGYPAQLYKIILHRMSLWIACLAFAGLLWISWKYNVSLYQGYAILFAVILLQVIHRPVRLLETAPVKYAGKISFGIYLLHHFWVFFVFKVWPGSNGLLDTSPLGDLAAFGIVSLLTLITASLSYEYFESRFLRRKDRL